MYPFQEGETSGWHTNPDVTIILSLTNVKTCSKAMITFVLSLLSSCKPIITIQINHKNISILNLLCHLSACSEMKLKQSIIPRLNKTFKLMIDCNI